MSARATAWALALALCSIVASCGYRTGFTLPEGQTIGVEVFDNVSKERDLENEVHDALTGALERMVHAPLVSPSNSDWVVRGSVLEYARRGGIRSASNVQLENGVRIVVRARLVRTRGAETEQVLREVTVADDRGFLVEDPSGESEARARVLRNIADRLVLDLCGDLAYEPRPVDAGS